MSPLKTSVVLAAAMFMLIASGCSDANKKSIFDGDTGKHTKTWYQDHRMAYLTDGAVCLECHGADLHGGSSGVSCYNANFNGQSCHASGPAGHPSGWDAPASHGAAAKNAPNAGTTSGFSTCQACHGADFAGGLSSTSCFSCHGVNAPHAPAPWRGAPGARTHVNTNPANGVVCAGCHLSSGTAAAATCFNNTLCHAVPTQCTYCHTNPPSGSAAPNRAGAHPVHYTTTIAPSGCATCHNNAGIGTAVHNNGTVDVQFLSAYNAKSGAASHSAGGTCSKVSCHGGQTTPVWQSGTIDVNTQCTSCHAFGTTEYNSISPVNSSTTGRHDVHVNGQGIACTECHDTAKLALVHFNDLNTSVMTQAYSTLSNSLNYTGVGAGTYGRCSIDCHANVHNNLLW